MSATNILISVGAKTGAAVKGINDVSKALEHQATTAEKTRAYLKKAMPAALAVTGALVTGGALAIKAASDQEQAFGALDSVFKNQAASMQEWAKGQEEIGLSATEAGNAAALLGSQLKNSGSSAKEAAEQSQKLVGLGADLAATFGGPAVDAVDALSAAYKGEFDSLEKYGVSIKASDVQARLAAKGQGKLTGAAKKAAEQAAISDSTAGASERLKAKVKNLSAELGDKLLPYVEDVVDKFIEFTDWASENQGLITAIAVVVGGLTLAIIALNVAMGIWTAVTTAWSVATAIATLVGAAFGAVVAFITAPITLIILAIVALIVIIVLLYKNWDTVKDFLARTWQWIKDKAVELWGALKEWFAAAWQWIKDKATEVWTAIKDFFARTWQAIKDKVQSIWDSIKTWLAETWQAIKDKAVEAFNALKDKIAEVWGAIKDKVKEKVTDLLDYIKGLPGKMKDAIGDLGSLLYKKGRDLIGGLIDGIKSMASAVVNAILNLLPGPVRSVISNTLGIGGGTRATPRTLAVAGRSLSPAAATTRSAGYGTVTINLYGAASNEDARVVKRALEGYDVSVGRSAGQRLARAW
jgi:hypothetical protein